MLSKNIITSWKKETEINSGGQELTLKASRQLISQFTFYEASLSELLSFLSTTSIKNLIFQFKEEKKRNLKQLNENEKHFIVIY